MNGEIETRIANEVKRRLVVFRPPDSGYRKVLSAERTQTAQQRFRGASLTRAVHKANCCPDIIGYCNQFCPFITRENPKLDTSIRIAFQVVLETFKRARNGGVTGPRDFHE